jgi:hypothetical protein
MEIQWRPIIINNVTTNYIISEYANIRNIKTNKPIKASRLIFSDRERVHLYVNGVGKDYKIYRLVYQAFYGEIPEGMTIDHKDENIHNNHISNLRLLTASENIKSYLNNHPDHGFQKKYSNETIESLFRDMKNGMYYADAAKKHGVNVDYTYSLLRGVRRSALWSKYKPFPKDAFRKSYFTESEEKIAISLLIDNYPSREILALLDIPFCNQSINALSKLRSKIGIKSSKYFDEDILKNVDRLIKDGKNNREINEILGLEISQRNSYMLARRRQKLNIPNKDGNYEEIALVEKYISEGLSNNEILEKLGKEKSMYYVNLFGRLRQEFKKKSSQHPSTIENIV